MVQKAVLVTGGAGYIGKSSFQTDRKSIKTNIYAPY